MNIIDIVLLLVVIPMVIHGISKGFVSQAMGFAALVVGALVGWSLSGRWSPLLAGFFTLDEKLSRIICFALLFLIAAALMLLAGRMIQRLLHLMLLGWLDKLLGAAFALANALIISGLFLVMFDSLNEVTGIIDKQYLEDSYLYYRIIGLVKWAFPYLQTLIHSTHV